MAGDCVRKAVLEVITMSRYERFDRSQIQLRPIEGRGHDLLVANIGPLEPPTEPYKHPEFGQLVNRIKTARANDRPVILMMGAHPIKAGLSRYLVDLIRRKLITHLATNGAGLIHDFELATIGGTSESVARWIREGQFGLWRESGRLLQIATEAAQRDEGFGEAAGRTLTEQQAPHAEISLAANAWQMGCPMTVHVGIGNDIIHAHANCDGAALGQASYTDFLIFARTVQGLEGGVFLNLGTAVTGPEVYLKALSMARNVARQRGESICDFTTAVFDLVGLPDAWRNGPPSKEHPQYYYRPWKTILERTVVDGGTSFFFRGDHRQTVPTLWRELVR